MFFRRKYSVTQPQHDYRSNSSLSNACYGPNQIPLDLTSSALYYDTDIDLPFSLSHRLKYLPLELQYMILDHTPELEASDAFNFIRSKTCKIIEAMKPPYIAEVNLELGTRLTRKSRKLFGEICLEEIKVNKDLTEGVSILEDICEVRYAVGQRGICAVRLLGEQWRSNWVGQSPKHAWYGAIKGPNVNFHFNVSIP